MVNSAKRLGTTSSCFHSLSGRGVSRSYRGAATFACVLRKEEEAEKVKQEIRIIWGDYFKAPQMEKHPDIHDLAHKIMLKGSACKQEANRADAEALVELVNQFAEKFWDTKGVATERKVCPYPPSVEVVRPVL